MSDVYESDAPPKDTTTIMCMRLIDYITACGMEAKMHLFLTSEMRLQYNDMTEALFKNLVFFLTREGCFQRFRKFNRHCVMVNRTVTFYVKDDAYEVDETSEDDSSDEEDAADIFSHTTAAGRFRRIVQLHCGDS